MATVFGVDLWEAKHLRIGEPTSQLLREFFQISHFFRTKGESLLLVVGSNIINLNRGERFYSYSKYILSQALIFFKEHGVKVGKVGRYLVEFLYTADALNIHILGNLYSIGTPRSNHSRTRAYESPFKGLICELLGIAKEPFEFAKIRLTQGRLCSDSINSVFVFKKEKHPY